MEESWGPINQSIHKKTASDITHYLLLLEWILFIIYFIFVNLIPFSRGFWCKKNKNYLDNIRTNYGFLKFYL
jgi:hypothetical protein